VKDRRNIKISQSWLQKKLVGGVEPPPVTGHLSGGEPIVKPTQIEKSVFYFTEKGVIHVRVRYS